MSDENKETITPKVKSTLLDFGLPEVTEQTGDYLDESPPEAESIEDQTQPEPESESTVQTGESLRGAPDDKGGLYDPSIHKFPAEKTPAGRWKKKPKSQIERGTSTKSGANFSLSAARYAELYGNMHIPLLGNDAGISSRDDLKPLSDSIKSYLETAGYSEIDPKWSVLLSAVNYSMDVIKRPTVSERFAELVAPLVGIFKNTFYKLIGKQPKPKPKPKDQPKNEENDSA